MGDPLFAGAGARHGRPSRSTEKFSEGFDFLAGPRQRGRRKEEESGEDDVGPAGSRSLSEGKPAIGRSALRDVLGLTPSSSSAFALPICLSRGKGIDTLLKDCVDSNSIRVWKAHTSWSDVAARALCLLVPVPSMKSSERM